MINERMEWANEERLLSTSQAPLPAESPFTERSRHYAGHNESPFDPDEALPPERLQPSPPLLHHFTICDEGLPLVQSLTAFSPLPEYFIPSVPEDDPRFPLVVQSLKYRDILQRYIRGLQSLLGDDDRVFRTLTDAHFAAIHIQRCLVLGYQEGRNTLLYLLFSVDVIRDTGYRTLPSLNYEASFPRAYNARDKQQILERNLAEGLDVYCYEIRLQSSIMPEMSLLPNTAKDTHKLTVIERDQGLALRTVLLRIEMLEAECATREGAEIFKSPASEATSPSPNSDDHGDAHPPSLPSESAAKMRDTSPRPPEALYVCEGPSKRQTTSHFSCLQCQQTFTRRTTLNNHQRLHTGERPFACDFASCVQTFAQKNEMRRHRRAHIDERPFKCGGILPDRMPWGCGKAFKRRDGLLEHQQRTAIGRQCVAERDLASELVEHARSGFASFP